MRVRRQEHVSIVRCQVVTIQPMGAGFPADQDGHGRKCLQV
jgi:hypothetical protein